MGRTVFVLHSALSPNAVAEALQRSIDQPHWTPFSLSGYKGNLPLLGEVGENTFKVQNANIIGTTSLGNSMHDLRQSPEEPE
jgi:hypothetical protein